MMQDAYWWYEEQKEGLGEEFLAELSSFSQNFNFIRNITGK